MNSSSTTPERGKDIYSLQKEHWSRPVDEDNITHHLAYEDSDSFCGIDKRLPGVYNFGFQPIQNVELFEVSICKTCFKIWKKRLISNTNE